MKLEGKLDIPSLLHKFRHGLGTLSQVKWVSSSGFHISLAGIVSVAGFILAIRDGKIRNFNCLPWSSDSDGPLEKKWVVPGLLNLGNNCFLNVILQALASCSCFQRFLQKTIEEYECFLGEEWADSLPLTVALVSLMEELCYLQLERMALSPRKLMLVMNHYVSNFNLANQQDAEEAFFHILSLLREEASSCYVPVNMSLANATDIPNCRILAPKRMEEQTDHERWRQSFLGPFDGILRSILTCEGCSFQISLDFQFFHSLHLSPVLCGRNNIIMPGCSVEDCLRKFFVAERLDNYCCGHCWHGAAIKYLSAMDDCEADIEKLRLCCEHGSCDCKKLPRLEALSWSNNFSHTFKQLNIARCPKILCIHLQRASMNVFGELVKLQSEVVAKNCEENMQNLRPKQQDQHYTNHFRSQLDTNMLKGIYSKAGFMEDFGKTGFEISGGDIHSPAFQAKSNVPQNGCFSDMVFADAPMQSDDKVGGTFCFAPSERHMYCLVSVVEHFGRSGCGHYTVYRRVEAKNDGGPVGIAEPALVHWFCISDSQVLRVSEEEVLAAEASVLFYERMSQD